MLLVGTAIDIKNNGKRNKLIKNSKNYLYNTLNSILYNPNLIEQEFNIFFNKKFKKFPKITFYHTTNVMQLQIILTI